ncbi:MAG: LysM peptidoglycan-binding domain-containing protein [Leptolyngbya sp. PLA3]|nr:MAG: LysM peptidoglycan-binding domain-containing protein [Cyanobacteria bacterium CYA]MCE7967990.1 LysM peptidoglycan-binding domain-containing protein [Leptolyngbya sp. PL-A3]
MALPSQSGRPTTTAGRIYSSHRKRKHPQGGLPVLLGGAAALGLGIYGLLWVLGVFDGPRETESGPGSGKIVEAGDPRDDELRQLGDPLGLSRQNNRGSPSGSPGAGSRQTPTPSLPSEIVQGSPAGTVPADEPDESGEAVTRRNVLREGIEQSGSGGDLRKSGAGRPTGDEVLATDGQGPIVPGGAGATPPGGPSVTPGNSAGGLPARVIEADQMIAKGDKLGARRVLNDAMRDASLRDTDRITIRTKMAELNQDLVFGPKLTPGDSMAEVYEVQGGDRLSKICDRRELATHWRLIQRINGLKDPGRIQVGQKLKLVRGPFHAVIDKSEYRLDVYNGPPGSPETWIYVRSFNVGLGKGDGTPTGTFVVARNSKVENPGWVNPQNSLEKYDKDDPRNPIGEFWLGLEGQGPAAAHTGYGIHGTIEPDSIGKQMSLGCVRLLPDDIALVYELLEDGISIVQIVP